MNVVPGNLRSLRHRADQSALDRAALVFSSLSNPVRLAVLLRLIEREWSVNEMASDLAISQSALSQHLAKLRQAGIVSSRRDRQAVFYHCSDGCVSRLLAEAGLMR
jgi:ArsR family transcriptional regulator, virulence genes transcriptional regulator